MQRRNGQYGHGIVTLSRAKELSLTQQNHARKQTSHAFQSCYSSSSQLYMVAMDGCIPHVLNHVTLCQALCQPTPTTSLSPRSSILICVRLSSLLSKPETHACPSHSCRTQPVTYEHDSHCPTAAQYLFGSARTSNRYTATATMNPHRIIPLLVGGGAISLDLEYGMKVLEQPRDGRIRPPIRETARS